MATQRNILTNFFEKNSVNLIFLCLFGENFDWWSQKCNLHVQRSFLIFFMKEKPDCLKFNSSLSKKISAVVIKIAIYVCIQRNNLGLM